MTDKKHRKLLVICTLLLFVGSSIIVQNFNGNTTHLSNFQQVGLSKEKFGELPNNQNYSHTVFLGVGTSQNCPPCDPWNQNIYSIYSSGKYDFEYVDMIEFDHTGKILILKAHEWALQHSIVAYPTSILDGNYKRVVGNFPELLPSALNESGNRTVTDVTGSINLSWLGNATILINISIINNEAFLYEGYIKAFISEILSRYTTFNGSAYHFGFLDFAFDENILIEPGMEYTDSIIWDGKEHMDENGDDFGDITANNTQVTLVVYNSEGYVDETVLGRIANNPPNEPSYPYPSDGSTNISIVNYLSWTCEDPDGDSLTYDLYFGNNSSPPQESVNLTNTTYDLDILDFNTTYYWRIVAWDEYGASTKGPIWKFTTSPQIDLAVNIIKPSEKSFYLRDSLIFSYPFGTIVYGPINIEVNASSASGVKKVELFINDEFKKEDTNEPYNFNWGPILSNKYTIKVIATDNLDNQVYDEITVLKWRAHPFLIIAGLLIVL